MRPVALALALALPLAAMPLAGANQPPVPSALAPATARLHEPVTFTSTSVDPDGTIVSTTWEDSDGRTKSGTSVTMSFAFAGVHTIVLRVTDDAGATSSLDVPIEVVPTLMHGRAYALRADDETFADTGDHTTTQDEDFGASVGGVSQGALRVAAMETTLRTLDDRAVARADVGFVRIPHPLGYFLATGIEAESIVGCGYTTIAQARLGQLRFNDATLAAGTVAPNTRVDVPGGPSLVLNAQEWRGDRLAVTAIRILSPSGAIDVAHAEAGVTACPYA